MTKTLCKFLRYGMDVRIEEWIDVVIGNPPYIEVKKGAEDNPNISYDEKRYYKKNI
ncbi:MAG: Eco57I restriction-modification methylase domain-containing protein [Bacteroidales bacterium]|nr:Eco57I restriction-modification methylase domain-containing protein [Bacteroidales bacterium]